MNDTLDSLFDTLSSGYGFWNPLVLAFAFIFILALVYILFNQGNKTYAKRTLQTFPFMSGNRIDDPTKAHVSSDNVYWGFMEILKGYYETMEEAHTGRINDYLSWFVIVLAVLFLVIIMGGA